MKQRTAGDAASATLAGIAEAGPRACDLLIRNGYLLTLDDERRVFPDGAVAIGGTRILAIGPTREIESLYRPRQVIDAAGAAVHPGFIDGHYHATLHLTRGAISDRPAAPDSDSHAPNPYVAWLNALDDEDEYASALMACVEMARNGFTGFVEVGTAFEPDCVAQAAEDVGLRASLGDPFVWDRVDCEQMAAQIPRAPAKRARAERVLGQQLKRNADPDALVRGHVALYGIGTASDELILSAKALADANGVMLTLHQNFTKEDADFDRARFGRDPLVHFAEIGALGPNACFTHMNVLSPAEIDAVAQSGLSVVWHPGNYMFYGIARQQLSPMPELHRRGTSLAFGADVAKLWAFGELGFIGYLVAREVGAFLSCESILEISTLGGARAIGLQHELGALEPGKRADLVIRSNELPDAQPNLDVVLQLVMISRTKSVDTVIVGGEIVVRKGRLTQLDEAAVYARARASAARMAQRCNLPLGGPWPRSL
ncbi:MAG: amidohydrolase family protein [Kiloniellales bacterium]